MLESKHFADVWYSINNSVTYARGKGVKIENTLTKEILMAQWNEQDGRCSCCGLPMDLLGASHYPGVANELRVSVDKTIPEQGYTPDNITLMHVCCNRFKGTLSLPIIYAIAMQIVTKFEEEFPETTVDLDAELIQIDGHQYYYPRFHFESNGLIDKFGGSAECNVQENDS